MKLIQSHHENDGEINEYDQNQSLTETDTFLDGTESEVFAQLNN